jgi:hypothetical protein
MVTVLAPAMPSAAFGWLPGALFGLGTTVVLVAAGALIGALVRRRRLREQVAQEGAGWTLLFGGALFAAAGLAGSVDPSLMSAGIATGIPVYNLDQLSLGTALVVAVVLIALVAMVRAGGRRDTRPAPRGRPSVPPTASCR